MPMPARSAPVTKTVENKIRMEQGLQRQLKRAAAKNRVSINSEMNTRLMKSFESFDVDLRRIAEELRALKDKVNELIIIKGDSNGQA
jgi:hypothetical protein